MQFYINFINGPSVYYSTKQGPQSHQLRILKFYVKEVWSNGENCSRNSACGGKKVKEEKKWNRHYADVIVALITTSYELLK